MATTTYRPEYCDGLIEHMANGYSFESYGAIVSAGRSTLYDWCNDFPEFATAKEIAQAKALMFFEKFMRVKLTGVDAQSGNTTIAAKQVDTTMCIFALKTRFHKIWGEKHEVEHSGEGVFSFNIVEAKKDRNK